MRAEAARVLCDSFIDQSIVMANSDIPFIKTFKIGENERISLPDYLRNASDNLVSAAIKEAYEWQLQESGTSRAPVFTGFKKDKRFGKNVE